VLAGGFSLIVVMQFVNSLPNAAERLANHAALFADQFDVDGTSEEVTRAAFESSDPALAGNVNVFRGGVTWREHARYYGFSDIPANSD